MVYQLVTCPETLRLELIETDATPCGTLILDCSSFRPTCAADCPRTCAARLDRRSLAPRAEGGGGLDIDERVLGVGDELCLDVLGMLRVRGGVAPCAPCAPPRVA